MTPVQNPADPVRAVLTPRDAAWPAQLRGIAGMPAALYVRGAPYALARRLVAVVGTRRPSLRGQRAAASIAAAVAMRNVGVVSGLAYGVDLAAHEAALDACGMTVAVLAHGLDSVYPKELAPFAAMFAIR